MSSLIIFIPTIDPAFDEAGNMISSSTTGLFLFILLVNVLLNLPVDVISAYALSRIARGVGLRSAWVAWIPGGCLWVMGCLADDYQKIFKGRKSHFRWILLLHGVWTVFLWLALGEKGAVGGLLFALADGWALLPMALLSIGGIVAIYIALYKVYRYSLEENAVVFTAVGAIYSIPTPFFLLHTAKQW